MRAIKLKKALSIVFYLICAVLFISCDQNITGEDNGNIFSANLKVIILDYGQLEVEYSNENIIENYNASSEYYRISNDTLFIEGTNFISRPIVKIKSNSINYIDAKQWSDIEFKNISSFNDITVELNTYCNIDSLINLNGGKFTLINKKPTSDTIKINSKNVSQLNIHGNHLSPTQCVGNVDNLNITVTGAGAHFYGFELKANSVNAISKGIGKIQVSAINELHAEIKSVGNIYYKGYPMITLDDGGIGSLINSN